MARNDTITIPKDQWTELTNANATAATFQVLRGTVRLLATVGAIAPTSFNGALSYRAGQGEVAIPLASLFPGITGANRIYAYSNADSADVTFSHA